MKPQLYASTFERLRGEPTWRLLSANTAPEALALMQHLLYDRDRVLPSSVLHERLTTELDLLRTQGRPLQASAAYYIKDWVASGWLERRYLEGDQEEEFELSAAAIQALRIVAGLQTSRAVATESRLALVMHQMAQLTRQTDADQASRLQDLNEQRRLIDEEIAAVAAGKVAVLEEERAIERLREILALARELSEDFRRVHDDLAGLDRQFRERIITGDAQRGRVLADLFAGVDVIAESPAGRTFAAFWKLLTDPEQSAQLEASVDALASRDFAALLPRDERQFLIRLTRVLLDRAGRVNNTQTRFARSLRTFVQSREYQEQRRLNALLQAAKADALSVRQVLRPEDQVDFWLKLSVATYRSVGQWRLHDPALSIAPVALDAAPSADISFEQIAASIASSDIDFRTLRANVRETLATAPQCSIASLLARFSAPQGLGTVAGYIALGAQHGQVVPEHREHVSWTGMDGVVRAAHIPLIYFLASNQDALRG